MALARIWVAFGKLCGHWEWKQQGGAAKRLARRAWRARYEAQLTRRANWQGPLGCGLRFLAWWSLEVAPRFTAHPNPRKRQIRNPNTCCSEEALCGSWWRVERRIARHGSDGRGRAISITSIRRGPRCTGRKPPRSAQPNKKEVGEGHSKLGAGCPRGAHLREATVARPMYSIHVQSYLG